MKWKSCSVEGGSGIGKLSHFALIQPTTKILSVAENFFARHVASV